MFDHLFINTLFTDPIRYASVIVAVVISIVLHELAHGWMAMRHGDLTPERTGHMTGNPLVHMGPFSLMALALVGIAWGQMPIDPSRMRGKYAEAKVAAAGPAVNLVLAWLGLTAHAVWAGLGGYLEPGTPAGNGQQFLYLLGIYNLLLCVFNLLPVPPLDGSHILANFWRKYALTIEDPAKQGIWILAFVFCFAFVQVVFLPLAFLAGLYEAAIVLVLGR